MGYYIREGTARIWLAKQKCYNSIHVETDSKTAFGILHRKEVSYRKHQVRLVEDIRSLMTEVEQLNLVYLYI